MGSIVAAPVKRAQRGRSDKGVSGRRPSVRSELRTRSIGAHASSLARIHIAQKTKATATLPGGLAGGCGSGDSPSFPRHLRPRKNKEKECSSHSSVRVLRRVFLRLRWTVKESCLPKVRSRNLVSSEHRKFYVVNTAGLPTVISRRQALTTIGRTLQW